MSSFFLQFINSFYFNRKNITHKEDAYASALFIVLKDHDCREAKRLCFMSMKRLFQKEVNKRGYNVEDAQTVEGTDYSDNPVQFFMTEQMTTTMRNKLLDAFEKMSFLDFQAKIVNKVSSTSGKSLHIPSMYRNVM